MKWKPKDESGWHDWFAWRPVEVGGDYTMKVLDTRELDTITFDEFLRIVAAQI